MAEKIFRKYPEGMHDLWVVFPNRRAGLFFTKALAGLIQQPVWSPRIISFEDFVYSLAGIKKGDQLTMLLDLFDVYQARIASGETFDKFYFWGDMLLKDFDEVDKYLVNPDDVFSTLKNLKEIDARFQFFPEEQKQALASFWSSAGGKESVHKEQFLLFWTKLKALYHNFQKKLLKEGYGYQGMIYRSVVNDMGREAFKWDKGNVVFAGFNALTLAEEKIIKWFLKNTGSTIYWDLDQHYFDDPVHEAGYFLRKYYRDEVFRASFPGTVPDNFVSQSKDIRVYASSQYTGQAKIAGAIVNETSSTSNTLSMEDTAVILPDEGLLPLLLYSLPDKLSRINITMGYSLRNSSFYSLIDLLLELQEKARIGREKCWFNHRPVVSLLNHPFISGLMGSIREELIHRIQSRNLIYVPDDFFNHPALPEELFRVIKDADDLVDHLLRVLLLVRHSFEDYETDTHFFEKEFSIEFYKFLNRLKDIFQHRDIKLSAGLLRRVIRTYARFEKVPFTGEPLEGLQIMGLLETRNLDFKHVIIMCANEGTVPKAAGHHSFIPFNVRKAFGLPLPESQDAMYAYLFYRLLQRASHIHLIYNTEEANNRKSEPSRFIHQLNFETDHPLRMRSLLNEVSVSALSPVVIAKDDAVRERLSRFYAGKPGEEKYLTPSKLNLYLSCPLSFCYRNVYDIDEKPEVTEDLDYAKFGNILHKAMEKLYEPLTGKNLSEKDFKSLYGRMDDAVRDGFALYHGFHDRPGEFRFEGKNILGREIILKYVRKILDHDMRDIPFRIMGLEKSYAMILTIPVAGQIQQVRIRGSIDRIDIKDDSVRIVDYKSGKDTAVFNSVEGLFNPGDNNRNKAAFQIFMYAMLYVRNHPENTRPVIPCLYNFKELHKEDFDLRVKIKPGIYAVPMPVTDIRTNLEEYEELLEKLVEEIFDPSIPYRHHEGTDKCFYCSSLGAPSEFS